MGAESTESSESRWAATSRLLWCTARLEQKLFAGLKPLSGRNLSYTASAQNGGSEGKAIYYTKIFPHPDGVSGGGYWVKDKMLNFVLR